MGAEGVVAAEYRRAALGIDNRNLTILAVTVAGQRMIERLLRRQAFAQRVQYLWAKGWQGDVLA
ncbi:hypothetical protein D3C77_574290 [compost metagenome]